MSRSLKRKLTENRKSEQTPVCQPLMFGVPYVHVYIYVHRNSSEEGRREVPPAPALGVGCGSGWGGGSRGGRQPLPVQNTPEFFIFLFFFLSFLNKNVSIHVFFKDKKDKENKRKLLNKPQSWWSEGWLERTLVNFIKKKYTWKPEMKKTMDMKLREKTGLNHMPIYKWNLLNENLVS